MSEEQYRAKEAEILDAGARRMFDESWAELLADFERAGKVPSAGFTASVLIVGTLALAKRAAKGTA